MNLEISREGRILRLTLNRPEKRNALSVEMCVAIATAVDRAQEDPTVGAILIDAAGPVFCAGMDLEEALTSDAAERTAIHERVFTLGFHSLKPIVAAVQGAALGGGIGLAASAHVTIAAQGTSFGLTEIRLGMWPFVIFRSVSYAMGTRRTTELALTGRIFSAQDALQFGLIHEVAPAIELDDRATATAELLANASSFAIHNGLCFLNRSHHLDNVSAGELARKMRATTFASEDFREGVLAFKEKRKPEWPSNKK